VFTNCKPAPHVTVSILLLLYLPSKYFFSAFLDLCSSVKIRNLVDTVEINNRGSCLATYPNDPCRLFKFIGLISTCFCCKEQNDELGIVRWRHVGSKGQTHDFSTRVITPCFHCDVVICALRNFAYCKFYWDVIDCRVGLARFPDVLRTRYSCCVIDLMCTNTFLGS
jgi:hypothetical protein